MVARTPAPYTILGPHLISGAGLNQLFANPQSAVENAITATAGGTQAAARVLTARFNQVSVCASANDSVMLPAGNAGALCMIANDGAQSLQVFGQVGDTIDGVATATGVAMAAAKRGLFWCIAPNTWLSFAGAKSS